MIAAKAAWDAFSSLEEREQHIIRDRTLSSDGLALREFGERYGVTRERVRQLEQRATADMLASFEKETAQSEDEMREFRAALLTGAGHLLPFKMVPEIPVFSAMAVNTPYDAYQLTYIQRFLLWVHGFTFKAGWVQWGETSPESIHNLLEEQFAKKGTIGANEVRDLLIAYGIADMAVNAVLKESAPDMRRFGEVYLPWKRSRIDKAEALLRWLQRPATNDELFDLVDEPGSQRSFKDRLLLDVRFMRTGMHTFGLREWGMVEYTNIHDAIAKRIVAAGGKIKVEELIEKVVRETGAKERSVRSYINHPRFRRNETMIEVVQ